jgi:hypothetical protein
MPAKRPEALMVIASAARETWRWLKGVPSMARTWYCSVVVNTAPLANRRNGPHFRHQPHAYVAHLEGDGAGWMLFDGRRDAAVLTPDQAKAALETERRQGQPLLAPKDTERRFLRAVYRQDVTRTRKGRYW